MTRIGKPEFVNDIFASVHRANISSYVHSANQQLRMCSRIANGFYPIHFLKNATPIERNGEQFVPLFALMLMEGSSTLKLTSTFRTGITDLYRGNTSHYYPTTMAVLKHYNLGIGAMNAFVRFWTEMGFHSPLLVSGEVGSFVAYRKPPSRIENLPRVVSHEYKQAIKRYFVDWVKAHLEKAFLFDKNSSLSMYYFAHYAMAGSIGKPITTSESGKNNSVIDVEIKDVIMIKRSEAISFMYQFFVKDTIEIPEKSIEYWVDPAASVGPDNTEFKRHYRSVNSTVRNKLKCPVIQVPNLTNVLFPPPKLTGNLFEAEEDFIRSRLERVAAMRPYA